MRASTWRRTSRTSRSASASCNCSAVKIARQATGRSALLSFDGAFRGRTNLALTLTSKTAYKLGCGPFAPEVDRLPYPNRFRMGDGLGEDAFVARELRRLEQAFLELVPAEHLAAVIIERRWSSRTPTFVDRFLETPLFSHEHARGFGTLYTAVYSPVRRGVRLLWPGLSWEQSLDAFREGEVLVRFPHGLA